MVVLECVSERFQLISPPNGTQFWQSMALSAHHVGCLSTSTEPELLSSMGTLLGKVSPLLILIVTHTWLSSTLFFHGLNCKNLMQVTTSFFVR